VKLTFAYKSLIYKNRRN